MAEIITYVSNEADVRLAINAGVDHLIIEDSKLSVGAFGDDYSSDFSKYRTLGELARKLSSDVKLSVPLDIMLHDSHFPILSDAFTILRNSPIDAVRIQDLGLISLIREQLPGIEVILGTGNNLNHHSIGAFLDSGVDAQALASDLPYSDIHSIYRHSKGRFEIQVQGPLLIQYSYRRFMAGLFESGASVLVRDAEDEELPNRMFRFLDTPNGHFMYGHFHRCLLGHGDILRDLPISGWIVDARGESETYFSEAIRGYLKLRDGNDIGDVVSKLKSESGRGQKPGFFMVNNTDEDWRDAKADLGEGQPLLGKVVDSRKGEHLILDVKSSFRVGDHVNLISTEGREASFLINQMWRLDGSEIADSSGCGLVRLDWVKGMSPGARLFSFGPL